MDTMGGFGPQAGKAISQVANRCRVMGDDNDATITRKRLAQKLRFVGMKSVATQILRRCMADPVIKRLRKGGTLPCRGRIRAPIFPPQPDRDMTPLMTHET